MAKPIPINELRTRPVEAKIHVGDQQLDIVVQQQQAISFTFRTFVAESDDLIDKKRADNIPNDADDIYDVIIHKMEFDNNWVTIHSQFELGRMATKYGASIMDKTRVCKAMKWLHKHQYLRLVTGSKDVCVNPELCWRGSGPAQQRAALEWMRNTPRRYTSPSRRTPHPPSTRTSTRIPRGNPS